MSLKDQLKKFTDIAPSLAMLTLLQENFIQKMKGKVFWKLEDKITGEIKEGKVDNVVTLDASILIARLLITAASPIAHQSEPSFGILALAVGTGYVSWDLQDPPPPTITQRSLWNEIGRKTVLPAQFVTSLGAPSPGTPTNIIDLTTTFSESEAVGPITEMGLIGGDININMAIRNPVLPPNGPYDPTVSLVGLDTLANYTTCAVINKNGQSTLSYTWRFTL
jgi:hypothetical protein